MQHNKHVVGPIPSLRLLSLNNGRLLDSVRLRISARSRPPDFSATVKDKVESVIVSADLNSVWVINGKGPSIRQTCSYPEC